MEVTMAVSGRTMSDNSLPAEDHICDLCLITKKQVDAYKYCVDCEKFLCRNCSYFHFRTSRNHQLVERDKVGYQPTTHDPEVYTEECPDHQQEVIKYFCPQHEAFGCHVCMKMCHKICEVDYIPNKCKFIANSKEYRRTAFRLNLKLQELDKIMQTTIVREQEIDKCHHNLLQEIIKFRKEINDYLDQLQQKIQKEADKKKTEDKQITQRILDGCNRLSSDIKKMQSTLQANETSCKYGQLYITMKQAQSVLRSDEIKADDGLERTAQQYIFEPNNSLMNMLSKQDTYGKLNLNSVLKTPRSNMTSFHKLDIKDEIRVGTQFDQSLCWLSGCGVLSSNKLVLADHFNSKLKLVNIHTKSVTEETSLDLMPWDVAVVSQDQIAVTMPFDSKVKIMKNGERWSTVRTISVTGECRGITHHHGKLYVVCVDPLCVLIIDKQGNVQNKISLNKDILSDPYYIEVSENSKLFYISDYSKNCVVSVTLQGEVTAVYDHKDLTEPEGMLMLDDGSLLVCSANGTIHHISRDMKQGKKVTDGLQRPYAICYNHHLHEIYICGCFCDQLTVLSPE